MHVSDHDRKILEPFILRGRRLMAHSLMDDIGRLEEYANAGFSLTPSQDGSGAITYTLKRSAPTNEEQVESAAARVRPMFLQNESIHYSKVLKALGVPNRQAKDARLGKGLELLKASWVEIDPGSSTPPPDAVFASWANADGVESDPIGLRRLGWAYIYGDVVHMNTENLAETKAFGVSERYFAATVLVCKALLAVRSTLTAISWMLANNYLEGLEESVFTDQVVADFTPLEVTAFAQAPVGSSPSTGGVDTLGPEWTTWRAPQNPEST